MNHGKLIFELYSKAPIDVSIKDGEVEGELKNMEWRPLEEFAKLISDVISIENEIPRKEFNDSQSISNNQGYNFLVYKVYLNGEEKKIEPNNIRSNIAAITTRISEKLPNQKDWIAEEVLISEESNETITDFLNRHGEQNIKHPFSVHVEDSKVIELSGKFQKRKIIISLS